MSHATHIKGDPPGADSKFKQQHLPSFYPEHNAFCVSVALAVCAIIFIPIGAVVLNATDSIYRKDIRYDDVNRCTINNNQGILTQTVGGTTIAQGCNTQAVFTVEKTIPAPVYIYYRIKGMHQNYRSYYDSRDDTQRMDGSATPVSDLCEPLRYPGELNGDSSVVADGRTYKDFEYNPCGLIAWSMFNDTINLYSAPAGTTPGTPTAGMPAVCLGGDFAADGTPLGTSNCEKKGIALKIDRESRFVAPKKGDNQWTGLGEGTDPYRSQGWYAFEPGHKIPITNDEDFMVWARPAAFPDFMKLYRQINVDLQPGTYLLDIEEFWDVTTFEGEKYVVISTQSWLGGKHETLGITMLAGGCLSFILAVGFILHHILGEGRKSS